MIAENVDPKNYALDYYKQYFKSDDEIHAIVNFNYNTTTKLSVMDNLIEVMIYEYVDKEEHDAKLLFSGMVLDEYFIDIDSGEILNAQEATSTKEVSPNNFVADVKDVIQGAIGSSKAITDAILKLKDYDGLWETITIDFGEVGHITNSKADIDNNGFGRYFPSENFKLQ